MWCRFLMCHILYTNYQRQGAVANMTAGEVATASKNREYRVVSVWEHKTTNSHGSAKLAVHIKVYQLLQRYIGDRSGADLVFTSNGEKVTHVGLELEKLGEAFGKKFSITPTLNRKIIATAVFQTGDEATERATACHMTHSLSVHRSAYQHGDGAEDAVSRYAHNFGHTNCHI